VDTGNEVANTRRTSSPYMGVPGWIRGLGKAPGSSVVRYQVANAVSKVGSHPVLLMYPLMCAP
jgi:hypothetical protein